jgi:hypothetical protein
MVFTSAATSLRMSLAILVPSRILAGIRAPAKEILHCREDQFTTEKRGRGENQNITKYYFLWRFFCFLRAYVSPW